MEVPLTPLEFARRTRALYSDREAVVDGELRLTYADFFERCDRWSAALQRLGVEAGDRIAYIAPNTHAQLESFYAVPQIGAVLVPINYRLSADEFAYIGPGTLAGRYLRSFWQPVFLAAELPAGRAAKTVHIGPYHTLSAEYRRVMRRRNREQPRPAAHDGRRQPPQRFDVVQHPDAAPVRPRHQDARALLE